MTHRGAVEARRKGLARAVARVHLEPRDWRRLVARREGEPRLARRRRPHFLRAGRERDLRVGLHPIVTFQYSSTTLHQVSDHIQYLLF